MSYRNTTMRIALMAGTATLGAMLPTAASAQDVGSSADQAGLEEIIVTAQRREERLQDVPIAVSAVTANALRDTGVNSTRELTQIIPSVQVTRSGPSGLFFIRGVGTTNAAAGEEGANALYIDNVYIGDLGQMFNNFNNIQRVEVLKGPQGTLFGRNATGGLIHILTREPGNETKFEGQFGYGNYATVNARAYLATPVTDNLSVDLALTKTRQNDGWGKNLTLNTKNKVEDYWGARSKIVYRPTDTIKLVAAGDFYKNKDNLGLGWRIADGTTATGGFTSPGKHDTTSNTPALTQQKIWGVSLTAEVDLGFATLTSITAHRNSRNNSRFDVDGSPGNYLNIAYTSTGKTIQQEIRLASSSTTPLSWQVGAFYLNSKAATTPQQVTGAQNIQIDAALQTNSYAAFGEMTYAITPTTFLTGGIRYTADRRKFDGMTRQILAGGLLGPALPTASSNDANSRLNTNEFTYRVSLRQEVTDEINVYASVNRGFKAGTFNLQSPGNLPALPQFIMAYEAGVKSELFDRRVRLNVSAYHYDIDDFQVRSSALLGNVGAGTSTLQNAATVKVDGIDADFEVAVSKRLRFFGGGTVLNSRFAKFGGPNAATQAAYVYYGPATCDAPGTKTPGKETGSQTGGLVVCLGDASGNKLPMAPRFAASLGATYTMPVGAEGEVRASALYNYNDGYFLEPDNRRRQTSFHMVNGSIEYRPVPNFGLELWGKNLTKSEYAVQALSTAPFSTTELWGAPRTYGFNLNLDF